jgi:hypothetical protein
MPETATAPAKKVRRIDAAPLPPSLEALAPPAVQERSRELADIAAKAAETAAAARAANEGVNGARAADEAAAVEAAEQGKAPPKPTLPKAEERAQEAGREAAAHVELERRASAAYLDAVRDALPAMREAAEAELAKVGEVAAGHFRAIEDALTRSREVQSLLNVLVPDALEGREPSFIPAFRGKRARRGVLTAEAQEQLDGLRALLGAGDRG